jgi:hypothetical protein
MSAVQWFDCEQGSPEWFEARRGIPTASEFSAVRAKGEGKTRLSYMRRLVGEIITGAMTESYSNADIERGKVMEAEARAEYEFITGRAVALCGFARNGRAGASPDGLIDGGIIEFKTKAPHLLIECIERCSLPPEHVAQVQGAMMITETGMADFVAYWPGLPLFVVRVERDEEYIAALAEEIARFNADLDAMVERVRSYRIAA